MPKASIRKTRDGNLDYEVTKPVRGSRIASKKTGLPVKELIEHLYPVAPEYFIPDMYALQPNWGRITVRRAAMKLVDQGFLGGPVKLPRVDEQGGRVTYSVRSVSRSESVAWVYGAWRIVNLYSNDFDIVTGGWRQWRHIPHPTREKIKEKFEKNLPVHDWPGVGYPVLKDSTVYRSYGLKHGLFDVHFRPCSSCSARVAHAEDGPPSSRMRVQHPQISHGTMKFRTKEGEIESVRYTVKQMKRKVMEQAKRVLFVGQDYDKTNLEEILHKGALEVGVEASRKILSDSIKDMIQEGSLVIVESKGKEAGMKPIRRFRVAVPVPNPSRSVNYKGPSKVSGRGVLRRIWMSAYKDATCARCGKAFPGRHSRSARGHSKKDCDEAMVTGVMKS